MEEESLVLIKPRNEYLAFHAIDYLDEKLESHFSRTELKQIFHVPENVIREHCKNISHLSCYGNTVQAFLHRSIFLTCYTGEGIISRVRFIAGPTDPVVAKRDFPESIRAQFTNDSLEEAAREGRYLNNVIHASGNQEEARRDISLWRPLL